MTTVCVLVISHEYGDDVFVCANSDVARRQLEEHVDEWWDETLVVRTPGGEDTIPKKPEGVDEKVELYFDAMMGGSESYETFPGEEVIGAETKHTSMYGAILGVITSLRDKAEASEYTDTGDVWDNLELIEKMAQEGLGE